MFRIIFHYGLYSVPCYDCITSARRRKTQNGSEWYRARLEANLEGYRPISGAKETQEFHHNNYDNITYVDFVDQFNKETEKLDVSKWVKLAKNYGASCVMITTKHHDGFCLWNTHTTEFKSKRNVVEEFVNAAKKEGIEYGFYYSWTEFNEGCTKEYMEKVEQQMLELKDYKPSRWFFDGHWKVKAQHAVEKILKICDSIKSVGENIQINDRISSTIKEYNDSNYLGKVSTYRTYSDRAILEKKPNVPWEHINTIGLSWGRNKYQEKSDYKSGDQLYKLYNQVKELHGDFMINLGPEANGELDVNEVKSLDRFSELFAPSAKYRLIESDKRPLIRKNISNSEVIIKKIPVKKSPLKIGDDIPLK